MVKEVDLGQFKEARVEFKELSPNRFIDRETWTINERAFASNPSMAAKFNLDILNRKGKSGICPCGESIRRSKRDLFSAAR